MTQHQVLQRFLFFVGAVMVFLPLSAIADDRPDWRTSRRSGSDIYGRRGTFDLEGIVVSVNPNGDDFVLRVGGRRTLHVDARGGVPAYFNGRRYRVRDLERGDLVAVDLVSSSRRYRARAVEVLESRSHRGGYGRNDDYGRRGRYERLAGQVVSFNSRRDVLLLRTDNRRDVSVDIRRLRSERSIRIGDWLELEGFFDGRTFVAESSLYSRGDRRDDDWRRR